MTPSKFYSITKNNKICIAKAVSHYNNTFMLTTKVLWAVITWKKVQRVQQSLFVYQTLPRSLVVCCPQMVQAKAVRAVKHFDGKNKMTDFSKNIMTSLPKGIKQFV